MQMVQSISILFLFLSYLSLNAQVPNDSLSNRIALTIDDEPFHSNTIDCTVEHNYLNKNIAGQCIKYHNDQWFEFTPKQEGPYYIIITHQRCQGIRGIQLIAMSGIPFKPASYASLGCISSDHQDDFFLELTGLTPEEPFLINVDGYLHDVCSFSIHISSTPPFFSLKEVSGVKFHSSSTARTVNLTWEIPESVLREINGFSISRRGFLNKHYDEIASLETMINTFGAYQHNYQYRDSVLNVYGAVDYRITGLARNGRDLLIKETTIYVPYYKPRKEHYITFDPGISKDGPVTLLLFDAKTKRMIIRKETYLSRKDTLRKINVTPFIDEGIHIYRLVRIENSTGRRREYLKFKRED